MSLRAVVRDALQSVVAVLLIGMVLFAVSGVWPPMVAVESQSMEPNLERGDLVFVTEPERFGPASETNDGIVTAREADGYRSIGGDGDVIVFLTPERNASGESPIIHRAMFHVEKGENWYAKANPAYLEADGCTELRLCPAPHDGYVTKGDNNAYYDQANSAGLAPPVKSEWVHAEARFHVPWLGKFRLWIAGR